MAGENTVLKGYINTLCKDVAGEYTIGEEYYRNQSVKRGLRNADGTGVLAGVTRIGSVQGYYVEDGDRAPMPGRLYYRGIDVTEIAESHQREGTFGYEEVAYLLLLGKLPTAEQYAYFNTILSKARALPDGFSEDMILKVSSNNVMNMLSRCVLALYPYDPAPEDNSIENLMRQSIELIGRFPSIVATAYAVKRHHYDGKSLYIHIPKENLSVSENFLRMLRKDKAYTPEEARLLDLMLILHAEHGGGNNSTFTCRSLSSTGTDTYSAIAGAVSALKGPLHGGANAKVMEMFADIKAHVRDWEDEDELNAYLSCILDGAAGDFSGKLYGLGHAVYTMSDPRAQTIKKYARTMAEQKACLKDFELVERVERLGIQQIMERKKLRIPICANVDLYSGLVYSMLGIPQELYTPLFAIARIAGWCAHRIEEVVTCNRIIRPAYRAAVKKLPYVPMAER
jgi:citrate synthase